LIAFQAPHVQCRAIEIKKKRKEKKKQREIEKKPRMKKSLICVFFWNPALPTTYLFSPEVDAQAAQCPEMSTHGSVH
jgi:hypothetical protein